MVSDQRRTGSVTVLPPLTLPMAPRLIACNLLLDSDLVSYLDRQARRWGMSRAAYVRMLINLDRESQPVAASRKT